METCDYDTAILRASRQMDWSEEEDGFRLSDNDKTVIDVIAALYPNIDTGQIIRDLNNAVIDLIEDSRENYTQDQDDASQRAEELLMHPPRNDD